MSAPPLFRHVDERRVTVVRDARAVHRVFDADPVGSCMVAARVADHGIDPTAIGGELWTRRHAEESLCYAGANLIPLRGSADDLNAFADKANTGRAIRTSRIDSPAAYTPTGGKFQAPAAARFVRGANRPDARSHLPGID